MKPVLCALLVERGASRNSLREEAPGLGGGRKPAVGLKEFTISRQSLAQNRILGYDSKR
jgi:hypothetical protein